MGALLRRAVAKGGGRLRRLWLKTTKATVDRMEIVSFVALSGWDLAVDDRQQCRQAAFRID
jgi:hypothetical protein